MDTNTYRWLWCCWRGRLRITLKVEHFSSTFRAKFQINNRSTFGDFEQIDQLWGARTASSTSSTQCSDHSANLAKTYKMSAKCQQDLGQILQSNSDAAPGNVHAYGSSTMKLTTKTSNEYSEYYVRILRYIYIYVPNNIQNILIWIRKLNFTPA